MLDVISEFDKTVLFAVRESLTCGFLDTVMPVISRLGNNGLIWLLICAFLSVYPKYRNKTFLTLMGLLAGLIIGSLILKNVISRPRPFEIEQIALIIDPPSGYSFPSGHTLSSFIAAAGLTFTNKKFAAFAYPLATLIAFSRIYLCVHYISDIVFSMILGTVIAVILIFVYTRPSFQESMTRFNLNKHR